MSDLQPITLTLPNGGVLLIETRALAVMQKYKQIHSDDPEAAGIFTGEYRGEKDIRIVDASQPQATDKRSRFRFSRSAKPHQQFALAKWKKSSHLETWLGEWHTHPETHPNPSSIDMREWRKSLPLRPMCVAIQGTRSIWFGLWDGRNVEILL